MYSINEVVNFKLDGSETPGYAKAKLLKPTIIMLGYQCWEISITEITNPSTLNHVKVGAIKNNVSERYFSKVS